MFVAEGMDAEFFRLRGKEAARHVPLFQDLTAS